MKRSYFLLIFLVFSFISNGQLYINEFMASNASVIQDPDFNQDADWIELYNDGTSEINLSGYFLTDNFDIPNKWSITNVIIPAKGFAIFWADGKDSANHTSFKLDAQSEMIGLFKPDLTVLDSVSYTNQQPNISQGRNINELSLWGHFSTPTPNASNSTEFFSDFALNEPMFNVRGGIYTTSQSITLFTDLGGEIRYTLDGSDPTTSSELYTHPINISTTSVIRARIFKPDMLPGNTITNTYFINEPIELNALPIVSLSTNPENFWDATKGIYVQTFKPDWEIPVNIEFFENNGADRQAFNEVAGIKVNGLYSWQLPQKMLGVYFKKRYGSGSLDYTIFNDSKRSGFKTFALRASGNDWSNTLMRDIVGQNATKLNMNLDISAYRWTSVYVNGKYLGIHNFREKIETDYIEKNYGLEGGTFDMIENEDFAECGDLNAYNELKVLFSKDLSIQSNFDAVAEKMDIENFTDLVITEIATGNSSIDHNVMAWKPKDFGKWKWIVMDLDRAYFSSTSDLISFSLSQTSFPFSRLMQNSDYKIYFGKRLADHMFTSFHPSTLKDIIDMHKDQIENEIPRHIQRWLGTTSSYGNAMPSVEFWENEVEKVRTFTEERPVVIMNDLTNYGFSSSSQLTLSVFPERAATLKINDFKISQNSVSAPYPKNLSTQISTYEKAGFIFKGWNVPTKNYLIAKQSTWKYLDNGTDQGNAWKESEFNDASWKSGQSEFGYGDNDEKTTISYGTTSNKYVTSYFRNNFSLTSNDLTNNDCWINLLKDDGAVVYINGIEVFRDNIKDGDVNYKTLAATATSGILEKAFYAYHIDNKLLKEGNNTIAVEIHQSDVTSSDLSFELEMINYIITNDYISTEKTYPVTLTTDLSLVAVYEKVTSCTVPELIDENITLYKNCSPYIVNSDVTINKDVTLTIEPGVEILFSPGNNMFVHGKIDAIGTAKEGISFKLNPAYTSGWGALNFWNTSSTSELRYITIEGATKGPIPQRVGAINTFYGNLNLDHITIENTKLNPISARYSDIVLTNSYIHSSTTSDLINVKYGHARIENCTFIGNSEFDSDGIDYDGIENGIIRKTKIYNILGNNADAIDIGEEAHNIIIDSVEIVNSFDKGISIGQRSSVILTNSTLINCNMGVGIKDSSKVSINQCTFYGNGSPISCYEKNPGRAGGNARIYNSILSNSSIASYESDNMSTIHFENSLSDNPVFASGSTNINGNPLFKDPTHYDFTLLTGSPGIAKGLLNGKTVNIGTSTPAINLEPDVVICEIYMNPLNTTNPEYIGILNVSKVSLDLNGYSINKGVNCLIPEGTVLNSGDTLYITSDASGWSSDKKVVQWIDGKLNNQGESIEILNKYGMVADYLNYSPLEGWPLEAFNSEAFLSLTNPNLDNHFAENWIAKSVINGVHRPDTEKQINIYPNPATEILFVKGDFNINSNIMLYNSLGQLVLHKVANQTNTTSINVSELQQGIYILKIENKTVKVYIQQ